MVYYSIKQVIKYIVGTKWSSFYKKYVKDKYSKLLTVITSEIIYIVYNVYNVYKFIVYKYT